jgi:hypothetical protein
MQSHLLFTIYVEHWPWGIALGPNWDCVVDDDAQIND